MLPRDAEARKAIPVYSGFIKYFPDAIAAVAQLSALANEQHNPGQPIHWAKEKSTDELDAMMRHLLDSQVEARDEEGVLHMVKVAWRAMANLQRMADAGTDILAQTIKRPPHRQLGTYQCKYCKQFYESENELVACNLCVVDYLSNLSDEP